TITVVPHSVPVGRRLVSRHGFHGLLLRNHQILIRLLGPRRSLHLSLKRGLLHGLVLWIHPGTHHRWRRIHATGVSGITRNSTIESTVDTQIKSNSRVSGVKTWVTCHSRIT